MKKPVIAIFVASNISTKDEEALIEKYHRYPCVILNAETFDPEDNLTIDAAVGKVPVKYKGLPNADELIKKFVKFQNGVGEPVGGNPPAPPAAPAAPAASNKEADKDDKVENPAPPAPPTPPSGFGNPPAPPAPPAAPAASNK